MEPLDSFPYLLLTSLSNIHIFFFFFTDTATTEIYTLSLHDALPILHTMSGPATLPAAFEKLIVNISGRSEEHTSELQSRFDLVCRLLLEKKKKKKELHDKHHITSTVLTTHRYLYSHI